MPFADPPVLLYTGLGQYVTVGPTEYVGSEDVITIPGGFQTDLATSPRIFWAIVPPHGGYENAAVVHDFLCAELARCHRAGETPEINARDTDALGWRRIMRESGVGFVTRWILWAGVRYGALANPARRPGWLRDSPLVLAITVLVLAATGATVYGLDRLAHFLGGIVG